MKLETNYLNVAKALLCGVLCLGGGVISVAPTYAQVQQDRNLPGL